MLHFAEQQWFSSTTDIYTDYILEFLSSQGVDISREFKGEGDIDSIDILGNTVESAIQATKQALYNLDHPLEYVPKSIEVQQACMKEREFYVAFLDKLENL